MMMRHTGAEQGILFDHERAARTLEYLDIENHVYEDCGVAGLWRLPAHLKDLDKADILIRQREREQGRLIEHSFLCLLPDI